MHEMLHHDGSTELLHDKCHHFINGQDDPWVWKKAFEWAPHLQPSSNILLFPTLYRESLAWNFGSFRKEKTVKTILCSYRIGLRRIWGKSVGKFLMIFDCDWIVIWTLRCRLSFAHQTKKNVSLSWILFRAQRPTFAKCHAIKAWWQRLSPRSGATTTRVILAKSLCMWRVASREAM